MSSEAPKATDVCEVCGREFGTAGCRRGQDDVPEEAGWAADCFFLGYSRATARAESLESALQGKEETGRLYAAATERIALLESALRAAWEQESGDLIKCDDPTCGCWQSQARRALSGAQEVGT